MTDTNFDFGDENQDETTDIIDDLDLSSDVKEDKKQKTNKDDEIVISKSKLALVQKLLTNIQDSNEKIVSLLSSSLNSEEIERISIGQMSDNAFASVDNEEESNQGRIVEGVFDGESMIGPDGKQYSVPANYASKSKLVEGDIMKLTITSTGTFVYKQIGPIERSRIVGELESAGGGSFIVNDDGKKWKVLTASVTYYKGQAGDEVVILVPKVGESNWGAIDNIVNKPN